MSQAKNHSAAERFARFANRSEMRDVARRYADLIDGPGGLELMLVLSFSATMCAQGLIARRKFDETASDLALKANIPRRDMKRIAMYALEVSRCDLAGIGRITLTPANLGNEEGGHT